MSETDLATIERLAARIYQSSPGLERWGWEYIDPGPARPSPALRNQPAWTEPVPPDVSDVEARSAYLRSKAVKRGVIIGGLLLLATIPDAWPLFVSLAVILAAAWFGPLLTASSRIAQRRNQHQAERSRAAAEYQRVHGDWERSVAEWDTQERDRLEQADLWFPVSLHSTPDRVDVFGGTPGGWSSLLAVMGTSLLRAGTAMLVLDMSGNDVAVPLAAIARSQQLPVLRQELPGQLDQADLLCDLSSAEIAELIGETLATLRAGGDDVSLRMLDTDLLKGVAERLDSPVTFARIAAGLRVLQGSYEASASSHQLSGYELQRLADYVDSVGRSERAQGELQFLRTALDLLLDGPLPDGEPGVGRLWTADGGLTLLVSQDPQVRRRDLVDRLVTQSLLQHLRRRPAGGHARAAGVLVLAGADHLGQPTLEELARQAKNAGIRLVLLIEHLRGEVQQLLGGSDSASLIMRLGNAKEAAAAAEYIGRGYSFKLTQLSQQAGMTRTTGTSTSHGTSATHSTTNGRSGGRAGSGWNQSQSDSESTSAQDGTSESWATSHSDTETVSRVYEFSVEPTMIQSLPATAFVLVESADGARRVTAGSCDPLVVTLDRVADGECPDDQHPPAGLSQPQASPPAARTQSGGTNSPAMPSVFVVDPPGQLHYLAHRLGQAGYVVQRVDVPGAPLKSGWKVTSADGSPVLADHVMAYR